MIKPRDYGAFFMAFLSCFIPCHRHCSPSLRPLTYKVYRSKFTKGDVVNGELLWVLTLLLIAIVLFATNKLRMDVVALLIIIAFVLSGTLSLSEATAGFSDPNVILIAALFVIGDGLVRTGVAYQVGDWLVKVAGDSEAKMLVLLMITVAALGAVMSSTGVVAYSFLWCSAWLRG